MRATRLPRRYPPPVSRGRAAAAPTGNGSINAAPVVRLGMSHGADLARIRLAQRLRAVARESHRRGRADAFGTAARQRAAAYIVQVMRQRQAEAGAVMLARPGAGDLAET